jgi:2'-5' RNA ligase
VSEVIAVSTGSLRTYPVPAGVVAEVLQGVRWTKAYDVNVPEPYQRAAAMLASGSGLDLSEVESLSTLVDEVSPTTEHLPGWNPGEGGYPSRDLVLSSLAGGDLIRQWSESLRASLGKQIERENEGLLASISYDPDTFAYLGLCAAGDEDIVTDLVRNKDSSYERWDPDQREWQAVEAAVLRSYPAVEPDSGMLAAIVAAVKSGDKLLLVYSDPLMFLPDGMTVTAFPDDVETSIVAAAVDDIDDTAVWSVLRIEPGPEVSIRAAGGWEPAELLERPRLVLLDEALAADALERADSIDFGSIYIPSTMVASDSLVDLPDVYGFTAAMDRTFGEVIAMVGAYHTDDDDDDDDDDDEDEDYDTKTDRRRKDRALVSDIETFRDWAALKARRELYQTALDGVNREPSLIAAGPGEALGKYHPGAIRLRRYWTRGKGALKIRWGVHGDWRRCYRQLFKYLGPRAAGYCQLRHKQMTGMYTGDKAHRRGVSTLKASITKRPFALQASAATSTGGMIALLPTTEDTERLVIEGGESAEELHLTLFFLGDADAWTPEQRAGLANRVKTTVGDVISSDLDNGATIEAKVFGANLWNPDAGDDAAWVLAIGDTNELSWVHSIIEEDLHRARAEVAAPEIPPQFDPWVPHMTLAYGRDTVSMDDMVSRVGPITFDKIRVVFGGDAVDIPLSIS